MSSLCRERFGRARFSERNVNRNAFRLLKQTLHLREHVAPVLCLLLLLAGCDRFVLIDDPAHPDTQPSLAEQQVLRITADPNNLPFTNDKLEGFENKIAQLIADDLGMKIEYSWRAQRRGFFRETLKENNADLILGVPAGFERSLNTAPYYRSAYCFVTRKDRGLHISSFDDPALRNLKIGVQLIGDDGMNTPPAHVLANRGMIENIRGYTLYGDYNQPNPPARIIDAVANGDIDVAVVWGPLAGYFAKQSPVPLEVIPVSPLQEGPFPMAFSIAMGVRKKDQPLRDKLNEVLARRRDDIQHILADYGVPMLPPAATHHD